MTGLRAEAIPAGSVVEIAGKRLSRLRTFSDAGEGAAFWYQNANGLVEIAVNRGRADRDLGLAVGSSIRISLG